MPVDLDFVHDAAKKLSAVTKYRPTTISTEPIIVNSSAFATWETVSETLKNSKKMIIKINKIVKRPKYQAYMG